MTWFLLGVALGQDLPAGQGIDQALAAQVTAGGLDEVAALVPALIPTDALEVGDVSDSIGVPAICVGGSYEFSNIQANLQVNEVQIIPLQDEMELYLDLSVALNEANNPFTMVIEAICLVDENCSGWIDPFNLWVTAPLHFEVVGTPGSRTMDAVVGNLDIQHNLNNQKLQTDCLLNDIEQVMNVFGLSIFDLVVNLFAGSIQDAIEPALDEALAATNIAGELDLLDGTIVYALEPSAVHHSPQGLQLVFASRFDAVQAECIADDDPGGSIATWTSVPSPQDNPPGAHAAIHASSDMVNQVLYAAWRSGALCLSVGAGGGLDLGGLALDTSLLGLIGGEGFDALFPEPKPIELAIRPHMAPIAAMDGPSDLDVQLDEFELIFMAELDGRMARAFGVDVTADIGVNVPFDETTGEIAVDLVVDQDAIDAQLAGDELVDGVAEKIAEDFPAVMATLLDSMLPSLLGDSLAFALPTFEGLGLLRLDIEASGDQQDWLGAYAAIGEAPYADPYASGCGCGGGTGSTTSTDCGGCSSTGPRAFPVAWLLALFLVRRRE